MDLVLYDTVNPVDENGMTNMAVVIVSKVDNAEDLAEQYYGNSIVEVNGVTMYKELYVDSFSTQTLYTIVKDDNVFLLAFMTDATDLQDNIMDGVKAA